MAPIGRASKAHACGRHGHVCTIAPTALSPLQAVLALAGVYDRATAEVGVPLLRKALWFPVEALGLRNARSIALEALPALAVVVRHHPDLAAPVLADLAAFARDPAPCLAAALTAADHAAVHRLTHGAGVAYAHVLQVRQPRPTARLPLRTLTPSQWGKP